MEAGNAAPRTPQNKEAHDVVQRVVNGTNGEYGLEIQVPDHQLTPLKRKTLAQHNAQYGRWEQICRYITFLYWAGGNTLDRALAGFNSQAEALMEQWLPRPCGNPPKLTEGQKRDLEKAFCSHLESCHKSLRAPPLSFSRSTSAIDQLVDGAGSGVTPGRQTPHRPSPVAPAADAVASSPPAPVTQPYTRRHSRGKRPSITSDAEDDHPVATKNKRLKGKEAAVDVTDSASEAFDAIDNVPKRRRPEHAGPSARYDLRRQAVEGDSRLNHSDNDLDQERANGSRGSRRSNNSKSFGRSSRMSRVSRVFTEGSDDEDGYPTQTTVPMDSQDTHRLEKVMLSRGASADLALDPEPMETLPTLQRDVAPHSENSQEQAFTSSSYGITSSVQVALHESFSRYEARVPEKSADHQERVGRSARDSSPGQSTVYSSFEAQSDSLANAWPAGEARPSVQNVSMSMSMSEESHPLDPRLKNIWPKDPSWAQTVPCAVAWEVMRVCLHCRVDPEHPNFLQHRPEWASKTDIVELWKSLHKLDAFRGKAFPERPSSETFKVAMGGFRSGGKDVVLTAELDVNPKEGPLFALTVKPLKFDLGCRLTRHFGPDRFLQLLIPSPDEGHLPKPLKGIGATEAIVNWLTRKRHVLGGRHWAAFYIKDAPRRQKQAKTNGSGPGPGPGPGEPEAKVAPKMLIFLFAEKGQDLEEIKIGEMVDWLLRLDKNGKQPCLKLFSRISLGLTNAWPTLVFEPSQIRHRAEDILSPIGKVMNDGIGLMSRAVARKIRDHLGLTDIPTAVQGRIGSAKGVWIMDVADSSEEEWIETYPSQRKWIGDFNAEDEKDQRTLEIVYHAKELSQAGLNLQFLPVFEDRARNIQNLRDVLAKKVKDDLEKEFQNQKEALESPQQFRAWAQDTTSVRAPRVTNGHVPFLAGLPENKTEVLNFLLDSGFNPMTQKYIRDRVFNMQKEKCDTLKNKFNIRVGRSAYVLMVVDFWNVLEEDEVHLAFSNKFQNDEFSDTYLHGMDVLVARSPAHFASDVQRVRAVFKPELGALKDCIVFPLKGNVALADKLSGGDYDGDKAWVCWDPSLVQNFVNAEVPPAPDLTKYIKKDKTTYKDLVREHRRHAPDKLIEQGFRFNIRQSFLGIATNFKERYCYHTKKSASSPQAVCLSSLLGNLVDQGKQGIIFGNEEWDLFRKAHFGTMMYREEPEYKKDIWTKGGHPTVLADYLKFEIARKAIDKELTELNKHMQPKKAGLTRTLSGGNGDQSGGDYYDEDLVVPFNDFLKQAESSSSCKKLIEKLKRDLADLDSLWARTMASNDTDRQFSEKVQIVYERWREIVPVASDTRKNRVSTLLSPAYIEDPELTQWALIKASALFKFYYRTRPKCVWQIAGRQLAQIKSLLVCQRQGGVLVSVVPDMYVLGMVDKKFVKLWAAHRKGDGTDYETAMEEEDIRRGGDEVDRLLEFWDDD